MINAEAINSVTKKNRRRQPILTKDIVDGIPVLVQQGLNAEVIAARLGCTVGTLRVRCSKAQISLRQPKEVKGVPLVPALKPPKQKRSDAFALPTTLQLSRVARSRLRQHAEAIGLNEAQLASDLLEVIARDDLYDAVLDTEAERDLKALKPAQDRNWKLIEATPPPRATSRSITASTLCQTATMPDRPVTTTFAGDPSQLCPDQ